jgi:hypothetical protein
MTKITKMLARLVISIGLLGACAFCRRSRTQNGPLCRHGIHHGRQWRPLRSASRGGFSERAYAERDER